MYQRKIVELLKLGRFVIIIAVFLEGALKYCRVFLFFGEKLEMRISVRRFWKIVAVRVSDK
jgi:hypothetical protein